MNPWINVPSEAPFVLEEDYPFVEAFNYYENGAHKKINLQYTPEPRLGSVRASVVILQLNPSYNKDEPNGPTDLVKLQHEIESLKNEKADHIGITLKDSWWRSNLRMLIQDVGEEKLSKHVCSVEFFPYRSLQFAHGHIRLPSQRYTFKLVRTSLRNNAIVVVTRNLPLWMCCVPELRSYAKLFCIKNPRRITISRGNLPDGAYDKIVSAINDA